ncbi:MAG TPA: ATP-binding protein [Candidatus Hydrogenedentes bacterium]|nr:ATP-binding protein [Candidatus Hydrogenedentota bacterium]HOH51682.1 ATP-binding protein [Candidatus Hydrogenedentota bacterium]HQL93050.1 ATP-binding protein [Candidatus Hydrogenedentota bacterium]
MTPEDIQKLSEGHDLEVKTAAGQHGHGELPKDFWPTYSAMANTDGGVILLGVEEHRRGQFCLHPMSRPEPVLKALWDGVNNPQRISENLLSNADVCAMHVEGGAVIRVNVPRATRRQRPVYVGQNPMNGTYRRNYEGDYCCDAETVRRMLAERVEESRDSQILQGYDFEDLDSTTFAAYRNQFQARQPDHPWNSLDKLEFLRNLGGWCRDRGSGEEGLTLAGLLMFGKLRGILDAAPQYIVDYQERPAPVAEARWIDRITTDGTWSGNLFDFYRLVIQRLYRDLKVPFRRERERRIDDTPVHEALREALTNTLIHADFSGRISVLVVKRPDLFGFRNPGGLRVPLRDAISGGVSDCRNRNLQKMFQLVGLGEQAGSGLPKIYHNWREEHWRPPELQERKDPEQTLLILRMLSLLPTETLAELDRRFGPRFRKLPENTRLVLATTAIEETVTNDRMQEITSLHPTDITKLLTRLTKEGMLESRGVGRGTYYVLSGSDTPRFTTAMFGEDGSPVHNAGNSVHNAASSVHSGQTQEDDTPSEERLSELQVLAMTMVEKRRTDPDHMRRAILMLCDRDWLSVKQFADLLRRSYDTMRTHYLNPMVRDGDLLLRYPERPSHPRQCYRAASHGTRVNE